MKFTPSHEWITLQGNIGTVGITAHAVGELGEIVYIDLPKLGHKIKAGEEIAILESTKAAADIYSPVTGKITEVNSDLLTELDKLHSSPQKEGWLFKIELQNPKEYDSLLSKDSYQQLIE
ncbi:MAG TPA: glycine cleavage system protein GcvH [Chlamydiales bacterium]|nr:glycine cleavage system protein GcvH [Chlamydiales bacterium]